jgi:hypothetical protein
VRSVSTARPTSSGARMPMATDSRIEPIPVIRLHRWRLK